MFQFDLFALQTPPGEPRRRPAAAPAPIAAHSGKLDLPAILDRLARGSERPKHAFLVLGLIARASDAGGRAGPWIRAEGRVLPIRQWLCDALAPMAGRDPKRIARTEAVRAELAAAGALPGDPAEAARAVEAEVLARVRRTGLTHVSRAVSDLVRAGLLTRHYQGWRVDHHNRGAGRHAVYTVPLPVRAALLGC